MRGLSTCHFVSFCSKHGCFYLSYKTVKLIPENSVALFAVCLNSSRVSVTSGSVQINSRFQLSAANYHLNLICTLFKGTHIFPFSYLFQNDESLIQTKRGSISNWKKKMPGMCLSMVISVSLFSLISVVIHGLSGEVNLCQSVNWLCLFGKFVKSVVEGL